MALYDIWDNYQPNPGNWVSSDDSWTGMGGRMLLGATPTSGDIARPFKLIGKGISQGVFGQTDFEPSAPQLDQSAANVDLRNAYRARDQQQGLVGRLDLQARGLGPSVAQIQSGRAVADAALAQQRQAANARGVNRGFALRTAMNSGQNTMNQGVADAAMLRAQEQISANQLQGIALGQMRQGDIASRGQGLQAAMADQDTIMKQQALKTQLAEGNATRAQKGTGAIMAGVGDAIGGLMPSDIRAKEDISPIDSSFARALSDSLKVQPVTGQQPLDPNGPAQLMPSADAGYAAYQAGLQKAAADTQASTAGQSADSGQMSMGGIGGALSKGLGGFGRGLISDERSKSDLSPVHGFSYSYKPDVAAALAESYAQSVPPEQRNATRATVYADAREPRDGVMAQDLEKSKTGKRVVVPGKVLKSLDEKRAVSFSLAHLADLNDRVSQLEGTFGHGRAA